MAGDYTRSVSRRKREREGERQLRGHVGPFIPLREKENTIKDK